MRKTRRTLIALTVAALAVAAPVALAHDGKGKTKDASPVATVSSFDGTTLVVEAANGEKTSAVVNDRTKVWCWSTAAKKRGTARTAGGGHKRGWGHRIAKCPDGTLKSGAKVVHGSIGLTSSGSAWTFVKLAV